MTTWHRSVMCWRGNRRWFIRVLGVAGAVAVCKRPIAGAQPKKEEEDVDGTSLVGLWVSCPESTEIGPMFSDIQVWREGLFETRSYGRDPNNPRWAGAVVLTGNVDTRVRRFIPDGKHDVEPGQTFEYVVNGGGDLIVTSRIEGKVLKTKYRRLAD